ncbi:hypothetical protein ABMA10_18735 [Plantibacter sp. RU18]
MVGFSAVVGVLALVAVVPPVVALVLGLVWARSRQASREVSLVFAALGAATLSGYVGVVGSFVVLSVALNGMG